MTKSIVIEMKMSNSGSIYDIASDTYTRTIKFRKNENFAVIIPAYFGGRGYRTAQSEERAIKKYKSLCDYSPAIIDSDGNFYDIREDYWGDVLVKTDRNIND